MIQIEPNEHSVDKRQFIAMNTYSNGIAKMEVRLPDFESEGDDVIFFDFIDESMEKTGDYIPISMDTEELEEFIKYLTESLNKLKELNS